jgi:hypothetical protein
MVELSGGAEEAFPQPVRRGSMLVCQFLFQSGIVKGGDTRSADESAHSPLSHN